MSERDTSHKLFMVGQKAFIDREGEVLVLFLPNGWLDLPGGRIEDGESDLAESLRREVREETSLEIEIGSPFATWIGPGDTVYLVGYRCRYVSGDVRLSGEHSSYRWVSRDNFKDLDDNSAPFEALSRYFDSAVS